MSPHRRKGSPYWQVAPRVTLPGRGRVRLPARSSGTRSKQLASAMSRTLQELPAMGYTDVLERYVDDPSLTPGEIHAAKLSGRLEDLRAGNADPHLLPLLASFSLSDERVFAWTTNQVRHRFDRAVEFAGLGSIVLPDGTRTRLRIKDLRGVFATYYLRSGGSPRELQQILGHSRIETTLRYVKTLPVEEADNMAETEKRQGLALLGIERAG